VSRQAALNGYTSGMPTKRQSKGQGSKRDRSSALYVLLGPGELEALDVWVDKLNASRPVAIWTRTSVVRSTIARALNERANKDLEP
jgi:hypothetical protein